MNNLEEFSIRRADAGDLDKVYEFLAPFVQAKYLLPRTEVELAGLLKYGFVAHSASEMIGFAAVEVYSSKMAEIQCLAVAKSHQRRGIGKELVNRCVQCAQDLNVRELMTITSSEHLFLVCGFDYSLPNQKRALFFHPKKES